MDPEAVVRAWRDQVGLPRVLLMEDERELAELLARLLEVRDNGAGFDDAVAR